MTKMAFTLVAMSAPFALAPCTASAAVSCKARDDSFERFLVRFEEDENFQRTRILYPLVHRIGDYSTGDLQVELWSIAKVQATQPPLIATPAQRKAKQIGEALLLATYWYAEVAHQRLEGDDFRIHYKFRCIEGCWFLEEVHDRGR
jgi:hypothetical protein